MLHLPGPAEEHQQGARASPADRAAGPPPPTGRRPPRAFRRLGLLRHRRGRGHRLRRHRRGRVGRVNGRRKLSKLGWDVLCRRGRRGHESRRQHRGRRGGHSGGGRGLARGSPSRRRAPPCSRLRSFGQRHTARCEGSHRPRRCALQTSAPQRKAGSGPQGHSTARHTGQAQGPDFGDHRKASAGLGHRTSTARRPLQSRCPAGPSARLLRPCCPRPPPALRARAPPPPAGRRPAAPPLAAHPAKPFNKRAGSGSKHRASGSHSRR